VTAWKRGAAVAVLLAALAPLPWLVGRAAPGTPAPLRSASARTAPASGTDPAPPASPASPAPAATPALKSAAAWADAFDQQWRATRVQVRGWAASGDSWQQYRLAYSVDALTSAYLATGRTAYVEDALALLDAVAASSRPSALISGSRFHDRYRGWASGLPADGGDEVALYESYLWRYGTGLLRVVRQDPALWRRPDLRSSYVRLLPVAVHDVFGKWWSRGPDSYIYRERVHLSAHWALIAVNLELLDASQQRRTRYARVIREFVQGSVAERRPGLRTQLVASPFDPQAWFWSDVWGSYDLPGQDVSHGNAVVAFAVEAHDLGIAITDEDIRRFEYTMTSRVWPDRGPGAEHVDGSGTGTGWFSDGFVKLGRYDAALQARLEWHQPANGQFYAALALNAAILACGRSDGNQPPACRPRQGLLPLVPALRELTPPG
jgi:hypothetical protein